MRKEIFIFSLLMLIVSNGFSQVDLGDKVPNFKTTDHNGDDWELRKHLDKDYLVIYFYPAAFTGGCTKQACSYRDQAGDLSALGASVVGVSGDNTKTLNMFAEQNRLNFLLLSDEYGIISDIFGVPRSEGATITREIYGSSLDLTRNATIKRWTFIIDKKRSLIYRDSEVNASEDSQKVSEFLKSL